MSKVDTGSTDENEAGSVDRRPVVPPLLPGPTGRGRTIVESGLRREQGREVG